MSAIAGIWDFAGARDIASDCARMLAAQTIYGQDGENYRLEGSVALGRRLTRLLPEDVYDTQPLAGAHSSFVLVADLRLDNREDLAAELGMSAAQARTMCDAALLLEAFERWDDNCCAHLVGEYAFALWDARKHRLVLARDIIGSRPLHYHWGEEYFAFASMPKGLHALAGVPRAPDAERVAEFLVNLPEYGSSCFFKGIERVEPGHVVTITRGGMRVRRHWDWQRRTLLLRSADEYAEGLRHYLDQAVKSQLRGVGGRVAAHLSAGLDSSAVAATAARLLAPSGGQVIAFTAVPRAGYGLPASQRYIGDEGVLAAATAALYHNMEHVLIRSGHRSPLGTLDRNFFLFERPLRNLCNYVWIDAINDQIRARKLSVLLTGDSGNLTISYNGAPLLAELIRTGRWIRWLRAVAAIVRRRHWRLRGALAATFAPWLPLPLWLFLTRVFQDQSFDIGVYSAIHPARLTELDVACRARALNFTYQPGKDGVAIRLRQLDHVDVGNYNKGTLGGWGIDVRDPTSDRRLIEFCLSVPTEQFFREGVPRALARTAFADRLPPEVLNEHRRGLQAIDWHEGLTAARVQIKEEISRLEQNAAASRALDLARMRRYADNWPTQHGDLQEDSGQYRFALLGGIAVGHFLRRASSDNA